MSPSETESRAKLPQLVKQGGSAIQKEPSNNRKLLESMSSSSLLQSSVSMESPDDTPIPGLIEVRYGDNKRAILNSFCQNLHLINFMRQISGCQMRDCIDLMSWKAGELQNIHRSNSKYDYAYQYLKPRETYLLVKIVKDTTTNSARPAYMSLLSGLPDINPALADRLEKLSKPSKSKGRSKWQKVKKGSQSDEKAERKFGTTFKEAPSSNEIAERRERKSSASGIRRPNKLPPITSN